MKEGRIFDAHDMIVPADRRPKNIIRTGPDYVVSVHYLKDCQSYLVDKSVLSMAHYRKRWLNGTHIVDNRMKRFTPHMRRMMKTAQRAYDEYFKTKK